MGNKEKGEEEEEGGGENWKIIKENRRETNHK
jgi:hypothetical protein